LRKMFQEQEKENWEAITNCLIKAFSSRFRAPMHVGDGTNQQKYTSVLGARGT
jgi:hypothetical protein